MRLQIRLAKAGLLMLAFIAATSCGVEKEQTCQIVGLNVSPASATLDHLGDQTTGVSNHTQFAANAVYSGGCVTAACVNCTQGVTWSVSDPTNVALTPVQNQSVVTATCIGPTVGTATITASVPVSSGSSKVVTGTASLTCK